MEGDEVSMKRRRRAGVLRDHGGHACLIGMVSAKFMSIPETISRFPERSVGYSLGASGNSSCRLGKTVHINCKRIIGYWSS